MQTIVDGRPAPEEAKAAWLAALKAWQRWVGVAAVVAFLGTGWVLMLHRPPMERLADGARMLLRSGHVYLLFAGLLNMALGSTPAPRGRRRRRAALSGTAVAMGSPVALLAGFFIESNRGIMERPLTSVGVVAAFVGTLLVWLASAGERAVPSSAREDGLQKE
jgi:hypothetical protein